MARGSVSGCFGISGVHRPLRQPITHLQRSRLLYRRYLNPETPVKMDASYAPAREALDRLHAQFENGVMGMIIGRLVEMSIGWD